MTRRSFSNSPQHSKQAFRDDFDSGTLNLEWNFRRVPQKGTYTINDNDGYLRLFSSKNVIEDRKGCSLLGIRQKESDFEFSASMLFDPTTQEVQAGISLFQKDDNYFTFTVKKNRKQHVLELLLKEQRNEPVIIQRKSIGPYNGSITFKVISENNSYKFYYSLDISNGFKSFAETSSDKILSKGYTGAYLGLYCTNNGKNVKEYADFDWVELN